MDVISISDASDMKQYLYAAQKMSCFVCDTTNGGRMQYNNFPQHP